MRDSEARRLNALVEASSPDREEALEARARDAEIRANSAEERMYTVQRECARAQAEERRWKELALAAYKREESQLQEIERLRQPWWRRILGRR